MQKSTGASKNDTILPSFPKFSDELLVYWDFLLSVLRIQRSSQSVLDIGEVLLNTTRSVKACRWLHIFVDRYPNSIKYMLEIPGGLLSISSRRRRQLQCFLRKNYVIAWLQPKILEYKVLNLFLRMLIF